MAKTFKAEDVLTAENSKVIGVSIDRNVKIKQIRARISFDQSSKQDKLLYSSGKPSPSMEEQLERLGL